MAVLPHYLYGCRTPSNYIPKYKVYINGIMIEDVIDFNHNENEIIIEVKIDYNSGKSLEMFYFLETLKGKLTKAYATYGDVIYDLTIYDDIKIFDIIEENEIIQFYKIKFQERIKSELPRVSRL